MVFHWSLSDKSTQVSRTQLRILIVLSNAVIWIISTRLPISKSFRPFNNPLVILPKEPNTIDTIVTFMFHSFFTSLARSRYLSFFSLSFRFILWFAWTAKATIFQIDLVNCDSKSQTNNLYSLIFPILTKISFLIKRVFFLLIVNWFCSHFICNKHNHIMCFAQ